MTVDWRVEASGDLGTLSQFLYDIEKGPMALKLESVDLSARDDTGQQFTLGLQINGLALSLADKMNLKASPLKPGRRGDRRCRCLAAAAVFPAAAQSADGTDFASFQTHRTAEHF